MREKLLDSMFAGMVHSETYGADVNARKPLVVVEWNPNFPGTEASHLMNLYDLERLAGQGFGILLLVSDIRARIHTTEAELRERSKIFEEMVREFFPSLRVARASEIAAQRSIDFLKKTSSYSRAFNEVVERKVAVRDSDAIYDYLEKRSDAIDKSSYVEWMAAMIVLLNPQFCLVYSNKRGRVLLYKTVAERTGDRFPTILFWKPLPALSGEEVVLSKSRIDYRPIRLLDDDRTIRKKMGGASDAFLKELVDRFLVRHTKIECSGKNIKDLAGMRKYCGTKKTREILGDSYLKLVGPLRDFVQDRITLDTLNMEADDTLIGALTQARVRILRELGDGPKNVSALAGTLEMTPSAISQHMKLLKQAGLVDHAVTENLVPRAHRIRGNAKKINVNISLEKNGTPRA